MPLDPWEQWAAIHAGELYPDNRPRFRQVLILVARQNGKTTLLIVLTLYWLFIEQQKLVLGTSTVRDYAKETWRQACDMAQASELLAEEMPKNAIRTANGQETLSTIFGCRYKIAASNRKGGRSLTVNRLVMDELREHDTWDAYNAAVPATNAVYDAQVFMLSNQGDDDAIVLDSLRNSAIDYIETGTGDERLALFEWSSPDGSDPTDIHALAQSNPNLNRRIAQDSLVGSGLRAKKAGGKELAGFKTENMCMRVHQIDPAVDMDCWDDCEGEVNLAPHRRSVVLCLDVSLDTRHATLVAAAKLDDGRVMAETVAVWEGEFATKLLRTGLTPEVAQVKPRAIGWFPNGPAAVVSADIKTRQPGTWPPGNTKIEEIRGDVASVCMTLAQMVKDKMIVHNGDPFLRQHLTQARKLRQGDRWSMTRQGTGPIDGAYALAGAVYLAQTLPPPLQPLSFA